MDIVSEEKRSYMMSNIQGKDTKIELMVRKWLFANGLRYRKNDKRYPGTPDIVLPKYKTVIFVHGCFWHRHKNCKYAYTPKTRIEFWMDKINSNVERDKVNKNKLESSGWKVITVWECELEHNYQKRLTDILDEIK